MTITVIDGYTLNPGDLDWTPLKNLGITTIYEHSKPSEVLTRLKNTDIVISNKVTISTDLIAQLPKLKCICVSATGYNNVDIEAAKNRQIPVCNVIGYSTDAVAQHVFALLLTITNQVAQHSMDVHQGGWARRNQWCYTLQPLQALDGLTMGIYGLGRIGQQVANLAMAFGMQVLATHKHPERDAMDGVTFVDLETLFAESDIISLHAPLNRGNEKIINQSLLTNCKPEAILINTARGGLIDEVALKNALESGQLAFAALDVLSTEPPMATHPLIGLPNCIITPHNAWASRATRQRLLDEVVLNVAAFIARKPRNQVW